MWRKFLPALKAKTLEVFIEILKKQGATVVEGWGDMRPVGFAGNSSTVGGIGTFKHSVEMISVAKNGRRIKFEEEVERRFGSSRGIADADERRIAALKAIYIADQRLQEVKKQIPEIKVTLIGPTGGPMDEETHARLYRDARRVGLAS